MASSRSESGGRVVVFPFPFQGHFNPVMRLARALHARGFPITVLHGGARAPDPADYPADYRFVPVPVEVDPKLLASEDIAGIVTALNAACEAPFRDRLRALLDDGGDAAERVRCVLTDVSWDIVLTVSSDLGVPALGMMTASAASFRDYMAYRTLIDKGYLPVKEERKEDPVPELPPYYVKDLLRLDTSDLEEFAALLGRTVAAARRASGLIFNTFPLIETDTLAQIREGTGVAAVFAVAPLNRLVPAATASLHGEVQADRGCLEWLDTQRPGTVLYVSFGSMAAMDPSEFVELAWGLADSARPFVWVVRPNLVRGFESGALPAGVEDAVARGRGVVVSWAPQEEVLAHPAVGGFLTHNGWNSTVEAISEGVPMVCHPRHGDQYGNMRFVCDVWKVGTELVGEHLQRAEVKAAIDRLMGSEEGEQIRERMNALKLAAAKGIDETGSSHTDLTDLVDLVKSF